MGTAVTTGGADVRTGGEGKGDEDATSGGSGGSDAGGGNAGGGPGILSTPAGGPGRKETLLLLLLPLAPTLSTRSVIMSSAERVDTGGNGKRDAAAAWCEDSTGSDILRFLGGGLGALQ